MAGSTKEGKYEQLTLFDLMGIAKNIDKRYSADEIEKVIDKLREAKYFAKKREEAEQRRKEQEEKERRQSEEKARKDAHVQEVTSMDLPLDWNNLFNSDPRTEGVHVESIPDALVMSLTTLGRVDIEYISTITGEDYKTVICALKGSIFQNPETWKECFYKGWETSEEYLSSNLRKKWKSAQEADKEYNG